MSLSGDVLHVEHELQVYETCTSDTPIRDAEQKCLEWERGSGGWMKTQVLVILIKIRVLNPVAFS